MGTWEGSHKTLLVSSSPGDTEGSEEEPGKGTPFWSREGQGGEGRSTFLWPQEVYNITQRLKPELFSQRPEKGVPGRQDIRERLPMARYGILGLPSAAHA